MTKELSADDRIFLVETDEDALKYDPETGVDLTGWYFWDGTQAYAEGPFSSREVALDCLTNYDQQLADEGDDDYA